MRKKKGWKCWRVWYQGPPGARGLYFYRDDRFHPAFRPLLRSVDGRILVGTRRRFVSWAWRYCT